MAPLPASYTHHARCLMWALILIASPVALLQAQAAERIVSAGPIVVQTDDASRFFKVRDANQGRPGADELQHGYLDAGTDALRSFTDSRIGSMERLAPIVHVRPPGRDLTRRRLVDAAVLMICETLSPR